MKKPITPQHTLIVMGVLLALALVWEFAALAVGSDATISELVWNLSENTFFVFAFAFVCGHWFFPKTRCVHCGRFPYRKEDQP
jgi:hypothetical protein